MAFFRWLEKAVKLAIGFGATIFFVYIFKLWTADSQKFFLFTGRLDDLIVVLLVGFGATFILEKLWKWEVREVMKPERRQKKWIRR